MEKKLSDYLHFHLGCELFTGTGEVTLVAVQKEVIPCTDFKIVVLNGNVVYSKVLGLEKPLLRPLSDMTEEEKKEAAQRWNNTAEFGKVNWEADAASCAYLLSKHFDLFGLIEAGLAIDKTKMLNREANDERIVETDAK